MLLEKGGDDLLMIEDEKQQNTAIIYAMGKFCYESAKAKADKVEEDPKTLLAEAKTCLDVFLKRMTPEQVAHPNETGATIFHVAASARDDDALKIILPYVDSKGLMVIDDGERTALHWAAESGSVQMVSMILEKTDPENLSMQDKGDERTPLHSPLSQVTRTSRSSSPRKWTSLLSAQQTRLDRRHCTSLSAPLISKSSAAYPNCFLTPPSPK